MSEHIGITPEEYTWKEDLLSGRLAMVCPRTGEELVVINWSNNTRQQLVHAYLAGLHRGKRQGASKRAKELRRLLEIDQ